jgi:indole-3-glycerol phosphate synthase
LTNFTVNLETTKQILKERQEIIKQKKITIVSESGLYTKEDLDFVKQAGANAVLIGESLVKQDNIELAISKLY